jgi:hypothetical protein
MRIYFLTPFTYMERADLKQFFRNVSPAVSEDEFSYRIQEIISVLDVGVEEAWKSIRIIHHH